MKLKKKKKLKLINVVTYDGQSTQPHHQSDLQQNKGVDSELVVSDYLSLGKPV